MKTTLIFVLATTALITLADEKVSLVADKNPSGFSFSPTLTLAQGESAQLIYGFQPQGTTILTTIAGVEFNVYVLSPAAAGPVTIAGPAEIKMRTGTSKGATSPAFLTFDVHRVGTASAPVPIPQEAGTTWTVILEASSDLVNWIAVQPGDYPSSTPQKYFRTRLVKKA